MEKEGASGPSLWALLKGAPEVVQPFLRDAPADYEKSYKRYASEGARCLLPFSIHMSLLVRSAGTHQFSPTDPVV